MSGRRKFCATRGWGLWALVRLDDDGSLRVSFCTSDRLPVQTSSAEVVLFQILPSEATARRVCDGLQDALQAFRCDGGYRFHLSRASDQVAFRTACDGQIGR